MPRYIDADAMKKDLEENYVFVGFADLLNDIIEVIDAQPTADVVERKDLEKITEAHEKIGYEKGYRDGYAQAVEDASELVGLNTWAGSRISKMPSAHPKMDEWCTDCEVAPRWIPCEERLPKPVAPSQRREWFITSNTYGGVTVTCYEFEASPFKEGWQTDMTILAWMPLPEPWKGE